VLAAERLQVDNTTVKVPAKINGKPPDVESGSRQRKASAEPTLGTCQVELVKGDQRDSSAPSRSSGRSVGIGRIEIRD
jgi:hypothetical protein